MNASTVLALPDSQGQFASHISASTIGISGILQQEKELNRRKVLRSIYFGSHAVRRTKVKYDAPKLEKLAVVTYVRKFHTYAARKEIRAASEQSGSVLVENVFHGPGNGRTVSHVSVPVRHRDSTPTSETPTNADGLSKPTYLYVLKEEKLRDDPAIRDGFNFMDQNI